MKFVEAICHAGLGEKVQFTTLPTADHEDRLYGTDENLEIIWDFVKKYI